MYSSRHEGAMFFVLLSCKERSCDAAYLEENVKGGILIPDAELFRVQTNKVPSVKEGVRFDRTKLQTASAARSSSPGVSLNSVQATSDNQNNNNTAVQVLNLLYHFAILRIT